MGARLVVFELLWNQYGFEDLLARIRFPLTLTFQFDSVNSIEGDEPLAVLHLPRSKLFVSPVEPAFATQVGAEVEPSVSATFTVIETGSLKSARDPPASPTTLNSDWCQTFEISSTLSE